jgi:hypothetical protein
LVLVSLLEGLPKRRAASRPLAQDTVIVSIELGERRHRTTGLLATSLGHATALLAALLAAPLGHATALLATSSLRFDLLLLLVEVELRHGQVLVLILVGLLEGLFEWRARDCRVGPPHRLASLA